MQACKCLHVEHALISLHTFKIPCPSLDMRRSNGRWCGHTHAHTHARTHARMHTHTHTHNLMEEEDGGQVWESVWLPIVDFLVLCFRFETVISQGLFFVVCFMLFVCFVFVLFFIEARNASSNQVQITVLNAFNILHTESCVTRWWAFFYSLKWEKQNECTQQQQKTHKKQQHNNNNKTKNDNKQTTQQQQTALC